MFLKEIDFLSQPITLFNQGSVSHSSLPSGILSIITVIIIIILSIREIKVSFQRSSETPSSTSFTYFIEDAGTISFNPSSLFHFISLENLNDKGKEDFNFSYFNAIGIESPITEFTRDNDIKNYDHWLYGFCGNENDIEYLKDIITMDYFTKSACIRKYYDSKSKEYYDINEPKFKWPSINHGTFHPKNNIYSIIIKECDQNILDSLFNGELICKDISEYDMTARVAHLNFIDQYIDILNYKNPISRYYFRLENLLDMINYSVHHLNFNPALIKSHIGYIFNKEKDEYSYFYNRNDVFNYIRNCDIFMGFSFYLNNRINYYERSYMTIQDTLSKIGGTLNIVLFIMTFINNYVNCYAILVDFNYLLNLFAITPNDIKIVNRKNILDKKLKQVEKIKKNSLPFARMKSTEKTIEEEQKESDKETVSEQSLNTEKIENNETPNVNNSEENNKENKQKNSVDSVFSFCEFFVYKITCRKKKIKNIKIFEDFRKKIISVEHLMLNFLKLNDLLNLEKRRSETKNKS